MSSSMTTPIFRRLTFDECLAYAGQLYQSTYFQDVKSASQALAKILCGQELGVEPFQAMTNIFIVKGKPTLSATLLASLVQRSGWASYVVITNTPDVCEIEFAVGGSKNLSTFSMDDARLAGLLGNETYKKYSRNMLFSRAISNGVRWYCPGVLGGVAYVEGELDNELNNSEPKNITPKVSKAAPTKAIEPAKPGPWGKAALFQLIKSMEQADDLMGLRNLSDGVASGKYAGRDIGMTSSECEGCMAYIDNALTPKPAVEPEPAPAASTGPWDNLELGEYLNTILASKSLPDLTTARGQLVDAMIDARAVMLSDDLITIWVKKLDAAVKAAEKEQATQNTDKGAEK